MIKTLLSSILTIAVALSINAQIVNIPDPAFKALLVGSPDINTNQDNEIQISEAQSFTNMLLIYDAGIQDLTGIEYFTKITILRGSGNNLSTVNLSQNTALKEIILNQNQLTSLDVSALHNLEKLELSANQLTHLNLGQNSSLQLLVCNYNQLSSLDLSGCPNLTEMVCSSNPLQSLDLSKNQALKKFGCWETPLKSLDLSMNPSLTEIWCMYNPELTELNVANGNNENINIFATTIEAKISCPKLHCIKVDDVAYSNANWRNKPAYFSFESQHLFYDNNNPCSYQMGTNENSANNLISIYPNPTSDKINFSVKANVQITNAAGQIVAHQKNIKSIDMSKQPSGIYFLTFINDSGQVLQQSKIVKK